jgi:hypothetical protein
MRGGAHFRTNGPSPATHAGFGRQPMSSGPAPESAPPRLDDLVREIDSHGWFGGRAARFGWAFGGFLIGASFWHVLGFWAVLGEAVLKRPEPQVSVVARMLLPMSLPNCTTLALNRADGRTISVPCAERTPLLEEARPIKRPNLSVAAAALVTPIPR